MPHTQVLLDRWLRPALQGGEQKYFYGIHVRVLIVKVRENTNRFTIKGRVKVTLEKATKTQRRSRGIALLFP